jgi:phage-related holin
MVYGKAIGYNTDILERIHVFLFGAFHVELAVALVLNFLEYSAWYLE